MERARQCARLRCAHRQAPVDLPHHSGPRRVRLRHLAATARAERNGNTGVWAQMSADPELGLVYLPVEMPSADYNGFNRPGDGLFAESSWRWTSDRQAASGTTRPCITACGTTILPCRADPVRHADGRAHDQGAGAADQAAFLFVLNRETGEPIWPIEERPVPQSESPYEKTSPTQPFPTRPLRSIARASPTDVLNDLTPALRAEAREGRRRSTRSARCTRRPAWRRPTARSARCMLPADVGGANWPGGSFDPETQPPLHPLAHAVFTLQNIPATLEPFDPGPGGSVDQCQLRPAARQPRRRGLGPRPGACGAPPGGGLGPRGGTSCRALPLIKPPYDRITAYDMNTRRDAMAESPHHHARQHPEPSRACRPRRRRGSAPRAASSSAR